jgi:hypothetical protein
VRRVAWAWEAQGTEPQQSPSLIGLCRPRLLFYLEVQCARGFFTSLCGGLCGGGGFRYSGQGSDHARPSATIPIPHAHAHATHRLTKDTLRCVMSVDSPPAPGTTATLHVQKGGLPTTFRQRCGEPFCSRTPKVGGEGGERGGTQSRNQRSRQPSQPVTHCCWASTFARHKVRCSNVSTALYHSPSYSAFSSRVHAARVIILSRPLVGPLGHSGPQSWIRLMGKREP